MTIQTAAFADPENSTVTVALDNGRVLHVPADPDNTDYQAVLAWVADGNTIGVHTPPPPPSLGDRRAAIAARFQRDPAVNHLLSVLDDRLGQGAGKTLADILAKET